MQLNINFEEMKQAVRYTPNQLAAMREHARAGRDSWESHLRCELDRWRRIAYRLAWTLEGRF